MHVHMDTHNTHTHIILPPPGTVVPGGGSYPVVLCFTDDVLFLFLLFSSPRDLQAPSADRRETLPRDQKYAENNNNGPKICRALTRKKWGQKRAKLGMRNA